MNRLASGNHRTGQPRWVQFTENAMKRCSPSRRSHAAVLATTPAHGSGDESANVTSDVVPTANRSTGPTARHTCAVRSNRGATRNPTNGIATIAAAHAVSTRLSREKNSRRRTSSGPSRRAAPVVWSLMRRPLTPDLADPADDGQREDPDADGKDQVRGHHPPEDEHGAERGRDRPRRPPGQM